MKQRTRRGLVIFDGDDTLWATQPLYDQAKRKFARLVGSLGVDVAEVIRQLDQVDANRVATLGYSRSRFPESMVETYKALCAEGDDGPSRTSVEAIRRIGAEVFETPPRVYPDTLESLDRLRGAYELALFTKGDPEVQERRIEQSGLRGRFDAIYIVAEKNAAQYRIVLMELGESPERVWAIGNSVRSDINPALEAGLRCVLVARRSWQYEEADLKEGEVTVVSNLREAVAVIVETNRRRS